MASAEVASSSYSPNIQASNDLYQSAVLTGKRVVICEDEGITQIQLIRVLKRAGLVVAGAANNGRTGVELVLREKPDLVMMDIRMPVMDGLEATRRILAEYAVCVVMLTAFADDEVREQGRQAGSRGFLLKPVTGPSLIAAPTASSSRIRISQSASIIPFARIRSRSGSRPKSASVIRKIGRSA